MVKVFYTKISFQQQQKNQCQENIQNWSNLQFIWAAAWQNHQNDVCAHQRLRSAWTCTLVVWWESSLCTQGIAKDPVLLQVDSEDWSDWADAQADLNLRWAHMSFCWFCHAAAHLVHWSLDSFWLLCERPFYRNDPKFFGQICLGKQCSLIRVYTVCHSFCIVWTHYSMVEPHSSNFRLITTNFLGVRIFRKFTVIWIGYWYLEFSNCI